VSFFDGSSPSCHMARCSDRASLRKEPSSLSNLVVFLCIVECFWSFFSTVQSTGTRFSHSEARSVERSLSLLRQKTSCYFVPLRDGAELGMTCQV